MPSSTGSGGKTYHLRVGRAKRRAFARRAWPIIAGMQRLSGLRRLFASHVVVRFVLLLALAVCGARLVAPTVFHFRSGDLSVRLAPTLSGGKTILHLGPFGDLSWRTHATPVNVEATFVLHPSVSTLPELRDVRDVRVSFLLRRLGWLLLSGLIAGSLLAEGMGRRTPLAALLGGGLAVGVAGLLVLVSVLTYNAGALSHPRYRGPIQDAPRVLSLLKEAQGDLSGVQRNINNVVQGLERIHEQLIATAPDTRDATVATRLLVISDLHNNPVGLLIAKQLADRFHVDAVLDAGDFTDRGTQIEGEVYARFAQLGVPQIIVAGNHEDRAAIQRVSRVPNTRFLSGATGDLVNVHGIDVLGDADPNADVIGDNPFDETATAQIPSRCRRLALRFAETLPEIVMVHDPRQGECAAALAQEQGRRLVFVWGHLHRASYEERGSVVSLSPGTSGANGIKSAKKAPYGFSLLEFDASRALLSVCQFQLSSPAQLDQAACHIAPR
jgi:predicted phosphodiesterase